MSKPWRECGDYVSRLPEFKGSPRWSEPAAVPPVQEHPELMNYLEGPPLPWFEPALWMAIVLIVISILLVAIVPSFTNAHPAVSR